MNLGNDYGVGSGAEDAFTQQSTNRPLIHHTAYWEDDPDPARVDGFSGLSQGSSRARTLQLAMENSDDEDQFPVRPPTKTSTRTTKGKSLSSRREEIFEPLFISSGDEEAAEMTKHGEDDDQNEGTETLRSAESSRKSGVRQRQTKRVVATADDSGSDDGTTFKGFGTRSKLGKRRHEDL